MALILHRREFLAVAASFASLARDSGPSIDFPAEPRKRLSVSTYPFRALIKPGAGEGNEQPQKTRMSLVEFAAKIRDTFKVSGIEPWSRHFESIEPDYVRDLDSAFKKAGVRVVNIPCDVEVELCSGAEKRSAGFEKYHKWVDAAVVLGSPSIRVHLPGGKTKQDIDCAVDSLRALVEYGARKNIIIDLENDDPRTEDPYRLLKVIETVNSPFLRALPDFCNSRMLGDEDYNYRALEALFQHALNISHVKDMEAGENGKIYRVDIDRIFEIAKKAGYRGYFSMEWEGVGDPYEGTKRLIEGSLKALA